MRVEISNDIRPPIPVTNYTDSYHKTFTFQEGCIALWSVQARANQLLIADNMSNSQHRLSPGALREPDEACKNIEISNG